jgi:hypothetical protein
VPRSEARFDCRQAIHVTVSTYRYTGASIAAVFSQFAAQKGKHLIRQKDSILRFAGCMHGRGAPAILVYLPFCHARACS